MAFFKVGYKLSTPVFSRLISTSSRLSAELNLTFACPRTVFYNKVNVKQVDVPGLSGCFGVLAEHVPTIANLKPGVVTVTEQSGTVKKYFVSSGSVTVNHDSTMQVLAEEAVTLDQLDPQAVRDGLTKAQSEFSAAQGDEAKAKAQVTLEAFEAMAAAV
ncbi:ATP synthase subunit delta, mitochondrial [Sparganum proliferum]